MRNFTTEDFSGSGQYLLRMSPSEIHQRENNLKVIGYSDTGFLSTIIRKVGWITNNYKIGTGEQIVTLTDMSDGRTLIGNFTHEKPGRDTNWDKIIWQREAGDEDSDGGKRRLVDWLNNPKLSQEHRFATQEEVVRCIMYQSSRWRN